MKKLTFLLILLLFSAFFPEKAIAISPNEERWIQPNRKPSLNNPYVLFDADPINVINPTTHPLLYIGIKVKNYDDKLDVLLKKSALDKAKWYFATPYRFIKESAEFTLNNIKRVKDSFDYKTFYEVEAFGADIKLKYLTLSYEGDISRKSISNGVADYFSRAGNLYSRIIDLDSNVGFARTRRDVERYEGNSNVECFEHFTDTQLQEQVVRFREFFEFEGEEDDRYDADIIKMFQNLDSMANCGEIEYDDLNIFYDLLEHVVLGELNPYENDAKDKLMKGMHSIFGVNKLIRKLRNDNNILLEDSSVSEPIISIEPVPNCNEPKCKGFSTIKLNQPEDKIRVLSYDNGVKILQMASEFATKNAMGVRTNFGTDEVPLYFKGIKTIFPASWSAKDINDAKEWVIKNNDIKTDSSGYYYEGNYSLGNNTVKVIVRVDVINDIEIIKSWYSHLYQNYDITEP